MIYHNDYRLANNQSQVALKWFAWLEHLHGKRIKFAGRSREICLKENILVEGFLELSENAEFSAHVFQFFGCCWHDCIEGFNLNRDAPISKNNGETLNERYYRTRKICKILEQSNYKLTTIWECSFKRQFAENANMREIISKNYLFFEPLSPRSAYFGGRTENFKKMYERGNHVKG